MAGISKRAKIGLVAAAFGMAVAISSGPVPAQEKQEEGAPDNSGYDANKLIEKMDLLLRADTNYSEMSMTIYNPVWRGPRTYEMEGYEDRVNKKSFIRILSPPRDRGKAFMKDGNVFKVYIPTERENKPITIPPSLMLQPWMGSDFTNDDLVRESSMVDDYTHEIEAVEKDEQGDDLVRIRLDPKPDAAVVWGKIVVWVNAGECLPVREVFYDDEGNQTREFLFKDVKEMDERRVPTVWEMKNLEEDKKGRRTVIEIKKIEFNVKIDDSVFSEKNLTRRDWE